MRKFKQIAYRNRVYISQLKAMGFSISEIARRTGFNKSSISREFKRNAHKNDDQFWIDMFAEAYGEVYVPPERRPGLGWTAEVAQRFKDSRDYRASKLRRGKSNRVKIWVIEKLNLGWSPEQIAGRSKIDGPDSVSYECIYKWIKQDRRKGGKLFQLLRRHGKRKRRFNPRAYKDQIPGRVSIERRPKIVDKRIRLGDLEADLIVGFKADGYVLTVVDRVSRRTRLKKLNNKTKTEVITALSAAIAEFKHRKTLTLDNGREFSLHQELKNSFNLKVYFTHPYTSQEKGTVENTNGLLRWYLPKGVPFKDLTMNQLDRIENSLNHRPRKTLEYRTPHEIETDKELLRKLLNQPLQL